MPNIPPREHSQFLFSLPRLWMAAKSSGFIQWGKCFTIFIAFICFTGINPGRKKLLLLNYLWLLSIYRICWYIKNLPPYKVHFHFTIVIDSVCAWPKHLSPFTWFIFCSSYFWCVFFLYIYFKNSYHFWPSKIFFHMCPQASSNNFLVW